VRRLLKEQKDDCGGGGGQNSPLVELEMVFDEKYLGYLCIFFVPSARHSIALFQKNL